MGWVHVQADDGAHLVDQQGMVGQLEGLAAMGTQSERPPDAADGGLTQSGSGCQGTTAPGRRTARSTWSSPIWRGAPGRISSPKAAIPPLINRFRHMPTVKPEVCILAATATLFCPRAHSSTMRARKARDRELRGC